MSGDWLTDGEEFTDRMMERISASAVDLGDEVEVRITQDMVFEVMEEMGLCKGCGLKRDCDCPSKGDGE